MASTLKPTLAGRLQHGEVALAAFAEAEVVTDHQVPRTQAVDQHVFDELLGSEAAKLR
jgi:hypothetical protein